MELFEQIRRDRDREGLSTRALAVRHGVHRRAVRQALASPVPPVKRSPVWRPAPKLGEHHALIDAWLEADRDAPRKQRHTARRVWQRLVEEHGAVVSERQVSRYDTSTIPPRGTLSRIVFAKMDLGAVATRYGLRVGISSGASRFELGGRSAVRRASHRAPIVAGALLVALLVALLAGMYVYDQGQRNVIAKGVRVAGVDLGGLKPDAARRRIYGALLAPLKRPVTVHFGRF